MLFAGGLGSPILDEGARGTPDAVTTCEDKDK